MDIGGKDLGVIATEATLAPILLDIAKFLVSNIQAFMIHVIVLIFLKGVLFVSNLV